MLFTNNIFASEDENHGDKQLTSSKNTLNFRDLLRPPPSSSTSNSSKPPFIKTLIFCTYVADWNWLAAELALACGSPKNTHETEQTKVFVIINWLPETCNTENSIPSTDGGTFSEGIREIVIGKGNPLLERKITLVHPALVGGLMHAKMMIVQFSDFCYSRIVIGSANLTLDDWCNLRQGFFMTEGKLLSVVDDDNDETVPPSQEASHHNHHQFGKEVEDVLLWLSLPKSTVSSLQLSKLHFPDLHPKTKLIFSIPSTLQDSLNRLLSHQQQTRQSENDNKEEAQNENDRDEDEDEEDEDFKNGIPPVEPATTNPTLLRARRKYARQTANAHEGRKEFYQNSFLPIAFELNKNYAPPLQQLRNCVESVMMSGHRNSSGNTTPIVYQASSVGGISDKLLEHFVAATNPSLYPTFPPKKEGENKNQEEELADANNDSNQSNPPPDPASFLITPFPSRDSVMKSAMFGYSGAITLRYFQLPSTQLYSSPTAWRKMTDEAVLPTCHTKLIFPQNLKNWIVVGSHNFTADCWAFAKVFLPRNFELSVFVPLKDGDVVSNYFPVQVQHDGAENSNYEQRFVFLNHKRQFFPQLQQAEHLMRQRNERIANCLVAGFTTTHASEKQSLMEIFIQGLEYHYSKFKTEVNDDFGRH